MILLNKEIVSVINIDKDLVVTYKTTCDRYLINIHRELTKQLVDYIVYYYFQEMENMFGKIIDNLLNGLYDDIDMYYADKEEFSKWVTTFVKSLEGAAFDTAYEKVIKYTDRLDLEMNKMYYIIENVCYNAEG